MANKAVLSKIRGTIKVPGTANIIAGDLVTISGFTDRFNGKAFVSAVSHSVQEGTWLTTLQIGKSPEWHSTLPDVQGSLPEVRQAPDVNSLLALMAEHHPSLRTRELAVVAGRSRLALEDREAWPEPTVGLSYGREAAPGPEAEADVWLFNLTFPIPLWRTNQDGRARAEAELVVADREREATATRLRGDLLQAAIALNAAVDRVALYETGVVPQLEENLVLLQRAYELGEVDVHQVSQTRERLLTATGQYIDARITYHETAATLEGLVGTELWPAQEVSP